MEIKLEPDLSHCIQTAAGKEYDSAMKRLLSCEEEDSQLEEKVELLRLFLKKADFGQLRSRSHPFLAEGKRVIFTLQFKNGTLDYQMDVSQE